MRKPKLFPLVGLNILLGLFVLMSNAYALGNATAYYVTVLEVLLKQVDGPWVSIAAPNQTVNLCSVSAGQAAAEMAATIKIPAGDYDNFKLKLSSTMQFSGSDGGYYTKAGGTVTMVGAGNAASTATWPGDTPGGTVSFGAHSGTITADIAQQGLVIITLNLHEGDSDGYMEIYLSDNLTTPISVQDNSKVSMWFDFDTQQTVGYSAPDNGMYLFPPKYGTQYNITVDGVATLISADDMQIDF